MGMRRVDPITFRDQLVEWVRQVRQRVKEHGRELRRRKSIAGRPATWQVKPQRRGHGCGSLAIQLSEIPTHDTLVIF
jgi:hypothetical protein